MLNYSGYINDPPIEIKVGDWLHGKKVLVTGAGGSIGRELCARLLESPIKNLVGLGRSEKPLFELKNQLAGDNRLSIVIADIRDKQRLRTVMWDENPDIIFHAAAYKHVGLMENHAAEAVKNNIFGTVNLLDTMRVKMHLIFVSTDKAVHPISVMGATKRFCEKYLTIGRVMGPKIDIVRLGNVIGSSGSVSVIFENCAQHGYPIKVSHPDMERFFITPRNAAALIIQAGAFEDNAAYVLDMGSPVNIWKLAEFIKHQYESASEIIFSQPGQGEKIKEQLFDRASQKIKGTRLHKLAEEFFDPRIIEDDLLKLRSLLENPSLLRSALFDAAETDDSWMMTL